MNIVSEIFADKKTRIFRSSSTHPWSAMSKPKQRIKDVLNRNGITERDDFLYRITDNIQGVEDIPGSIVIFDSETYKLLYILTAYEKLNDNVKLYVFTKHFWGGGNLVVNDPSLNTREYLLGTLNSFIHSFWRII